MCRREQAHAVAVGDAGVEALVQDCSSLDLLGVSHCTGQSLGVTGRQRVVQVVFHRLFGDGEAHSNRLMVITGGPDFLRVVVGDRSAFGLDRGGAEARKLQFFFERTLRGLGLVDRLVFVFVLLVLKAEQGV